MRREKRKWDWAALMIDVDPDDLRSEPTHNHHWLRIPGKHRNQDAAWDALGGVDSRDSLLRANQIQGCFLGGSLGCDGPFGIKRRGVGADGAADHRATGSEGLHRARQSDVRGRCAVDRAYGLSLA